MSFTPRFLLGCGRAPTLGQFANLRQFSVRRIQFHHESLTITGRIERIHLSCAPARRHVAKSITTHNSSGLCAGHCRRLQASFFDRWVGLLPWLRRVLRLFYVEFHFLNCWLFKTWFLGLFLSRRRL